MSYQASGLRAFLWQRISAVVIAIGTLIILGWLASGNYPTGRELIAQPLGAALFGLFWGAVLAHSWVGMRDIILDYVARRGVRYALLAGLALWLLFLGLWVFIILARNL